MSSLLRIRLLLGLLTALVVTGSWPSGARAEECGSPAQDRASLAHPQPNMLQGSQLPDSPLHGEQPGTAALVSAEDSPDDEELAVVAPCWLGRARELMQLGPASIQLEPAHAPSTQLDRPPRA